MFDRTVVIDPISPRLALSPIAPLARRTRARLVALLGLVTVLAAAPASFAGDPSDAELHAGTSDGAGGVTHALTAPPGLTTAVSFYWREPTDPVNGFQLSIGLSDNLEVLDDFTIDGTVLQSTGAEFIDADTDNDLTDGDGKEFVVGILFDSFPPFDDQFIPPTTELLEIGRVSVRAPMTLGESGTIDFVDSLNGPNGPPIDNILVVGEQSFGDFATFGATLLASGVGFVRGDCNDDALIDLADMIFLLNALFLGGEMPGCDAACDANSDRGANLADALFIGNYLFAMGPPPAAPFPDCGVTVMLPTEPTCEAFGSCMP